VQRKRVGSAVLALTFAAGLLHAAGLSAQTPPLIPPDPFSPPASLQAHPVPVPVPPLAAPPVAAAAEAPQPAVPPAPAPTPAERLRKAADLLIAVNTELGAPRSPYGELIYDIAIRHSINPHLVAALIHVESAFNPRAVSRKGAYGLMQLLPATARRFGLTRRKDLFNPGKNLDAGVRYLKWLTERFGGDVQKILAAYNAGEGSVERFGGIPPYRETQQYVRKIFSLLGVGSEDPATAAPQPPSGQTTEPAGP